MRSFITIGAMICFLVIGPVCANGSTPAAVRNPQSELSGCQNTQDHLITVSGLRVHYLEAGTGQTIVLIHGNAGSVQDFSYRAFGVLCGEYRVVAIDRPGHGGSDRLKKQSARLEAQAAWLHETLRALGIKRPILIGHSWGASVALAYALRYQDEMASMILLAPAAYTESDQGGWWMTALIKPPIIGEVNLAVGKLLFGKRMVKQELQHAFHPQEVPDDYLKSASASWLTRRHARSFLEDEQSLNASLATISPRYSEIRVPVIIVTGDADKIVPPQANAYRLKTAISQSQLIELKHTGHQIPQTEPQSIRNALRLLP